MPAKGSSNKADSHDRNYSLSSYEHPCEIVPPDRAYSVSADQSMLQPSHAQKRASTSEEIQQKLSTEFYKHSDSVPAEQTRRRRGLLVNMMDWYSTTRSGTHQLPDYDEMMKERSQDGQYGSSSVLPDMGRIDSTFSQSSMNSDMLESDDPRITNKDGKPELDEDDLEKNALRQMDYKSRRKYIQQIRIQFNVSCECSTRLVK